MSFLPRIMPAHPEAPEDFPPTPPERPHVWRGLLSSARSRREMLRRRYHRAFAATLKGL